MHRSGPGMNRELSGVKVVIRVSDEHEVGYGTISTIFPLVLSSKFSILIANSAIFQRVSSKHPILVVRPSLLLITD